MVVVRLACALALFARLALAAWSTTGGGPARDARVSASNLADPNTEVAVLRRARPALGAGGPAGAIDGGFAPLATDGSAYGEESVEFAVSANLAFKETVIDVRRFKHFHDSLGVVGARFLNRV